MKFRYSLEMLTIIAVIAFSAVFLYTSSAISGAAFAGSDTVGSRLIMKISGNSGENIQPLIPQWKPPSVEIESCLFAIQAAIGGILVGSVFGYWIGQKKKA
jgi:cobalt/nickel transport protein